MYVFESLEEKHRKDVIDIFNYYVKHTNYAYPKELVNYSFYDKFLENAKQLCAYAIINEKNIIIGFCQLKPYNPVSTFKNAVEVSYFLDKSSTGKGIGKIALNKLLEEARKLGKKQIIASISGDNIDSQIFHLKNGFIECGRFKNVGNKFGKEFDIVYMQRGI